MDINYMSDDILSLENTVPQKTESVFDSDKIRTGFGLYWTKEVMVPEYFTPLVNIQGNGRSKALPLKVHKYLEVEVEIDGKKQKRYLTRVCRKSLLLGESDCKWCKFPNAFDPKKKKLNKAQDLIVFPAYFFSLVGKMGTYEKDGEKIEYPLNPVVFLALNRGQEDINISKLIEDDMEDTLLESVYSVKKFPKELKQPMTAERENIKSVAKKFQHLPDGLTVPQDIRDFWDSKTKEEVRGLAANCYSLFTSDAPAQLLKLAVKPEAIPANEADDAAVDVEAALDG